MPDEEFTWLHDPRPGRGWNAWKLESRKDGVREGVRIVKRDHDLKPEIPPNEMELYEKYWKDWGFWRVHVWVHPGGDMDDDEIVDYPLSMPLEEVQAAAIALWRMR